MMGKGKYGQYIAQYQEWRIVIGGQWKGPCALGDLRQGSYTVQPSI